MNGGRRGGSEISPKAVSKKIADDHALKSVAIEKNEEAAG
jgi:hypothetical protein